MIFKKRLSEKRAVLFWIEKIMVSGAAFYAVYVVFYPLETIAL